MYSIRQYDKVKDTDFIMHNWLHTYKVSSFARGLKREVYYPYQRELIEEILSRPETETLVAVLTEEPDALLGFAAIEQDLLHYVYVKPKWRTIGIAKSLLALLPEDFIYTHITTPDVEAIRKRLYPNSTHNPYLK